MKLQDAFVSESGTNFGSWKMIGYQMNTNNNVFNYTEEKDDYDGETAALGSAETVWKAAPKAALNECETTDSWEIKIKTASSGNGAGYEAHVSSTNCNVLVPGFGKIAEGGAATIAD